MQINKTEKLFGLHTAKISTVKITGIHPSNSLSNSLSSRLSNSLSNSLNKSNSAVSKSLHFALFPFIKVEMGDNTTST